MAMRESKVGPSSRRWRTDSENRFMRRRYVQTTSVRRTRDTKTAAAGHAARNGSIASRIARQRRDVVGVANAIAAAANMSTPPTPSIQPKRSPSTTTPTATAIAGLTKA